MINNNIAYYQIDSEINYNNCRVWTLDLFLYQDDMAEFSNQGNEDALSVNASQAPVNIAKITQTIDGLLTDYSNL